MTSDDPVEAAADLRLLLALLATCDGRTDEALRLYEDVARHCSFDPRPYLPPLPPRRPHGRGGVLQHRVPSPRPGARPFHHAGIRPPPPCLDGRPRPQPSFSSTSRSTPHTLTAALSRPPHSSPEIYRSRWPPVLQLRHLHGLQQS